MCKQCRFFMFTQLCSGYYSLLFSIVLIWHCKMQFVLTQLACFLASVHALFTLSISKSKFIAQHKFLITNQNWLFPIHVTKKGLLSNYLASKIQASFFIAYHHQVPALTFYTRNLLVANQRQAIGPQPWDTFAFPYKELTPFPFCCCCCCYLCLPQSIVALTGQFPRFFDKDP